MQLPQQGHPRKTPSPTPSRQERATRPSNSEAYSKSLSQEWVHPELTVMRDLVQLNEQVPKVSPNFVDSPNIERGKTSGTKHDAQYPESCHSKATLGKHQVPHLQGKNAQHVQAIPKPHNTQKVREVTQLQQDGHPLKNTKPLTFKANTRNPSSQSEAYWNKSRKSAPISLDGHPLKNTKPLTFKANTRNPSTQFEAYCKSVGTKEAVHQSSRP